ncbi:YsnF/AvaK domain-containing protein [Hutsoniella sourekii]
MERKYVFGIYPTLTEAEYAVDQILQQGVPRESIALAGSDTIDYNGTLDYVSYNGLHGESHEDNRGFFERLFGFGDSKDNEEYDEIDFSLYKDSLARNEILVLVDQTYQSRLVVVESDPAVEGYRKVNEDPVEPVDPVDPVGVAATATAPYGEDLDVDLDPELDTETERIRLHEEQINVHTRKKDIGNVHITKEVIEETKTIEVPVKREEIRIHHTTPTNLDGQDTNAFVEEDIVIPISEEEIVIDKDVVVTDEV